MREWTPLAFKARNQNGPRHVLFVTTLRLPALLASAGLAALLGLAPSQASAEATLLIEADSGKVLHAENATYPWYPASVTKLMTTYVTLTAIKSGRIGLETLFTVSARANAQQPSKMGFKPGTTVTVDNALKMLMVKSANDIAVVLAEGVSGSVEQFADDMNATSRRLGMTQSSWVNPNGLPADGQITSARDLAILARALNRDFPEFEPYWHIPAIKFGKKVMRNTNALIGRYDGADGMKTGFICASGFNLVASASRNGKKFIVVVLGAPSSPVRAAKAAGLLERGFNGGGLSWLKPSLGQVEGLQAIAAEPPDLREEMCGKHRKRPAAEDADDDPVASGSEGQVFSLASLQPGLKPSQLLSEPRPFTPIVVFAGAPKKPGQTLIASTQPMGPGGKLAKNKGARVAAAGGGVVPETPRTVGPPTSRFLPPSVTDPHTAPWTSFAPTAAKADEVQPLTAMPQSVRPPLAVVPLPRPRPKIAKRQAPPSVTP